jgi:hypothetical protein
LRINLPDALSHYKIPAKIKKSKIKNQTEFGQAKPWEGFRPIRVQSDAESCIKGCEESGRSMLQKEAGRMYKISIIIAAIFFITLQFVYAESNNESDKLKNTGVSSSKEANDSGTQEEKKDSSPEIPVKTPVPIEPTNTPQTTIDNTAIFAFRAGEDNNSLSVESSSIDLGADLHSENGFIAASANIAFPIVGPFWINLETGLNPVPPNTLFVERSGIKLAFGKIIGSADVSFGPTFKFAGGRLMCTIRDAFYVVDKQVQDQYAEKKISAEEFQNQSSLKSFGLSYCKASIEYDDPSLSDSMQFGFDKIKCGITTQWKIDLFLIALEAGFNLDFSEYTIAQGIGITTKNFNLVTMFKTLSSEKGICIPPQVSVAIEYRVPMGAESRKTAEAK